MRLDAHEKVGARLLFARYFRAASKHFTDFGEPQHSLVSPEDLRERQGRFPLPDWIDEPRRHQRSRATNGQTSPCRNGWIWRKADVLQEATDSRHTNEIPTCLLERGRKSWRVSRQAIASIALTSDAHHSAILTRSSQQVAR